MVLTPLERNEWCQGRNRTNCYRWRGCWVCLVRLFVDAPKNAPKTKSAPLFWPRIAPVESQHFPTSRARTTEKTGLAFIRWGPSGVASGWLRLSTLPPTVNVWVNVSVSREKNLRMRECAVSCCGLLQTSGPPPGLTVTLPCRLSVSLACSGLLSGAAPRPNLAPSCRCDWSPRMVTDWSPLH